MNRKTIYEDLIQFDYFSDSYLQFEKDFNKYYKGVDPLTFLIDDILLTMAMKQKIIFVCTKVRLLTVVTIILFLK